MRDSDGTEPVEYRRTEAALPPTSALSASTRTETWPGWPFFSSAPRSRKATAGAVLVT